MDSGGTQAQPARLPCPSCHKSRALYCEDCVLVLEQPPPPQLQLPCKPQFDIVQHCETNARSTALHAALLARADTALHRHPGLQRRQDILSLQLPAYDPATTVVLFPEGPQTGVVGRCPPFERVVVLESNWKKAPGMLRHPALARLRRVQLPPGLKSQYTWRRGDGSFRGACDEGLSSIEAIYHCCRLLGAPGDNYEGLLRYFRRTQELLDVRGRPLPTSRQAARARERQQRARAAPEEGHQVAAAGEPCCAHPEQRQAVGAAAGAHASSQAGQPPGAGAAAGEHAAAAAEQRPAAGDLAV